MAVGKGGGRQGARERGRDQGPRSARDGAPASTPAADDDSGGARNWLLVAAVIAIPVVVFAVFLSFGPLRDTLSGRPAVPAASSAGGAGAPAQQGGDRAHLGDAEVQQMAERLAARLEREPGDANGWRTLARTYYVLKRFGDASAAYEKLAALSPIDDADVLADYADAFAMSQGQRLAGKPMELVRKALEKNPAQWKALSMAATDAFQRNDFPTAVSYWERALQTLPPDSEMAEAIRVSLAQARKSVGAGVRPAPQESAQPAGR